MYWLVPDTTAHLQKPCGVYPSVGWSCSGISFIIPHYILFFRHQVLGMSGGIEELGSVRWDLALCLLACWVVCYFSIWKGVRSSGKVLCKHLNVYLFVVHYLCIMKAFMYFFLI